MSQPETRPRPLGRMHVQSRLVWHGKELCAGFMEAKTHLGHGVQAMQIPGAGTGPELLLAVRAWQAAPPPPEPSRARSRACRTRAGSTRRVPG